MVASNGEKNKQGYYQWKIPARKYPKQQGPSVVRLYV